MRKALVVGIDFYEHISPLFGCVTDAHSVKSVLERNSDGTINFAVKLFSGASTTRAVSKIELKDGINDLFATDSDIALLYFAGHGHVETTGGYLLASDSKRGDDGVALSEILTLAHKSKAKNRLVVLDSCHAGAAGNQR